MLTYHDKAVRTAADGGFGPFQVIASFFRERRLIGRLVRREIESRYKGSLLGVTWSFATPVMMVAVYTFVFSVVFQMRWSGTELGDRAAGHESFGIVLFAGLIVFQFFADCFGRAPGLVLENTSYIKKIVFPLDSLGWVVLGGALFNAVISTFVLLVAHAVLVGIPPWTAILFPVVMAPLLLMTVGVTWIIAAAGVYLRDLRQVVAVLTTMLMFLSPIFYPLSMVPESLRPYAYINPLTVIIQEGRAVLLFGEFPDWQALGLYALVAYGVAWLGLVWFRKVKKGFVDVV